MQSHHALHHGLYQSINRIEVKRTVMTPGIGLIRVNVRKKVRYCWPIQARTNTLKRLLIAGVAGICVSPEIWVPPTHIPRDICSPTKT